MADDVLSDEALAFVADLQRTFGPRRRELLERRARAGAATGGGRGAGLPAGDGRGPRRRLAGRAGAGRPERPPLRDHRTGGPQDDDQRAELGRAGLHGRPRGLPVAELGQRRAGAGHAARRAPAHPQSRDRREGVPARRASRDARGASARLAPHRAPRHGRRRADVGQPVRLRPATCSATGASSRRGGGPVLLPAEAGVATSRPGSGTTCSCTRRTTLGIAARHHPRHGPDRDHPRRVRDGRDPLRAARALRGAQRGPLGLHLQHDQEARRDRRRDSCCRPRPGDHDRAVHARLHASCS